MKQKIYIYETKFSRFEGRNRQFYNNSSIHQDFNTPLTIMNTITTQKISKEIDLTQ